MRRLKNRILIYKVYSLCGRCDNLSLEIIKSTPESIKNIPVAVFVVICSLKNSIPTSNDVKGSSAPSIAVVVEPINFIATVRVSSEIIVGNTARQIKHIHMKGVEGI